MSLSDEVETTIKECGNARESDTDLKRLVDFMGKMKDEGLLLKREYGIPLIDTIGKPLYRKRDEERSSMV